MLFRHIQPLFLQSEYVQTLVRGPKLLVRPMDSDAPDHLMRFIMWATLMEGAPPASPPGIPPVSGGTRVVGRPQLLIEVSADGEGWSVSSTIEPRERPYLVTVGHMLPFVRVRLLPNGTPARAYAQLLANAPFVLDGKSPLQPSGHGGRP
jgi:hypothetical protein